MYLFIVNILINMYNVTCYVLLAQTWDTEGKTVFLQQVRVDSHYTDKHTHAVSYRENQAVD